MAPLPYASGWNEPTAPVVKSGAMLVRLSKKPADIHQSARALNQTRKRQLILTANKNVSITYVIRWRNDHLFSPLEKQQTFGLKVLDQYASDVL